LLAACGPANSFMAEQVIQQERSETIATGGDVGAAFIPELAAPQLRAELRQLIALAAPAVGLKISHMALGFTDFIFVSRLGTDATAAASPATLFAFIILCLGIGSVTSIQTFAAQALGRREPERAAPYVWQSFYIGLVFFLLTVPAVWLMRPFWIWIGHPAPVREMEIAFCEIDLWSMGLAVMCCGLESFFNGVQRPGVALWSVVVAIVFNALGDYVLIFGKFGFPAMGIRGSAVATVIAWGIRLAMMLTVFLSQKFNRTFQTRHHWRLDLARLREVFSVGFPIGLQWFLDVGAWFVFLTIIMAKFGTVVMAASNIALQFMHLSFMPAIGIGIAVNSLVGHAIGARKQDLAVRHARVGLAVMMTYMVAVGAWYFLARHWIIGLLSTDASVIAAGSGILIWAAVFQAFDAIGINYIFALRGAGDTKWPSMLVIFHCWVTFIGGAYLVMHFAPGLGLHGPWMMCTLYIMLLGVSLWRRWRRGEWKKIELFRESASLPQHSILEVEGAMDAATVAVAAPEALAGVVLPEARI
jgi:MATE family multidrug resistance protein